VLFGLRVVIIGAGNDEYIPALYCIIANCYDHLRIDFVDEDLNNGLAMAHSCSQLI
jgi:hypothetical protein